MIKLYKILIIRFINVCIELCEVYFLRIAVRKGSRNKGLESLDEEREKRRKKKRS